MTPTLAEQLGQLVRTSQCFLRQRVAASSRRPFQQVRALWLIGNEGLETQAALADRLIVDAAAASRLVDRLETAGLLARRPGKDRRTFRLAVTRRAAPEIAFFDQALRELEAELPRHLVPADVRALRLILARLNRTFSLSPRA